MQDKIVAQRARSGGVWRRQDFRKLWLASTISRFGSEVSGLALPLTAVLTLNVGPIGMGILGAAGTAPSLAFGLFAGAWVDRLQRRGVLIACDLARAVLLVSIPIAWAAGALSLPYLVMVAFLVGLFTVFFDVANTSYLPSLLRGDELVDANSKLEISESLTQLTGPSSGGLLVQALTAPFAIAIDALSFIVSAVFIRSIGRRDANQPAELSRTGMLAEVAQGLRFAIAHPLLRATMGYAATTQLCMSAVLAVYLLYVVDELKLSPAVIGLIGVAPAPGTILGALGATRLMSHAGLGRMMSAAAWLPGLAIPLMALAGAVPGLSVAILVVAWFLLGLGSIYDIGEVSLRQATTPGWLRGRVNATRHFAFYGVMPIGAILGGVMGAAFGLRPTILVAAVGLLLGPLWILASPIRRLAEPPAAE